MESREVDLEQQLGDGGASFDDGFPRTYYAAWSKVGLQRFPGPFETNCRTVLPVTEATFKLQALNAQFGRLSVTLDTFDRMGHYPGHNVVQVESEVPIAWGIRLRIPEIGGRAWVDFHGASLRGTPMMELGFSAPWKARRDDRVCFSGANTFKRRFHMTRIAINTDDAAFSFRAGADD